MLAQRGSGVHGEGVDGRAGVQHDKGMLQHLGKAQRPAPGQGVVLRGDEHQPVAPVGLQLHAAAINGAAIGQHAQLDLAVGHGQGNVAAGALFQRHADLGVLAQKAGQIVRQKSVRGMGVGPQADMAAHAAGKGREVGVHLLQRRQHLPGIAQQGLPGAGQGHAPGLALKQLGPQGRLQPLQTVAGRGRGQKRPRCTAREVALFGNGDKQAQVGQVVVHGGAGW